MNQHRPQLKFDELEVGYVLKNGEKLLQIVEIDYRRNIVYYQEIGTEGKHQGALTESLYARECQNGNMYAIPKANLSSF